MRLEDDQVSALATGCALLGSGGGGATDVAEVLLRGALAGAPVELGAADRLAEDAVVATVGAVGSSTAMLERIPSAEEFVRAARATEARLGRPLAAVQSLEIGGVNGLLGACVAAWLGLPLLDADAMGRAYPRLNLTTLAGHVPLTPLALSAPRGEVIVIDTADERSVESLVRAMLPSLGSWAAMCLHPATAAQYRRASVQFSLSRALDLGHHWQQRQRGLLTTAELFDRTGARHLYEGTVAEVIRTQPEIGGVATIHDGGSGSAIMRLDFANEYILAFEDGYPVSSVPEIIVVLDQRTWKPISVEQLAVQQRVRVLALPAPPELFNGRHDAENRFGLRAYGREPVHPQGAPDATADLR
ncbi:DUF917 domain-containing protein [Sciscionella marina]|uniref:DUF917 domain-containing protein n=1 Tax=Sciscionella marina TaxID=508770 RepID=UPI0003771F07|nr:DUF917 domain-containing protein [Sciscionella marina]